MTDSTYVNKEDRRESDLIAAGTYYVGDPCYVIDYDHPDGDLWDEFLSDAWKDADANRVRILDGRVRGARVVASGTAYGDGTYRDNLGNSYCVDAGLIGVVNTAHWFFGEKERAEAERLGAIIEFTEPFKVAYGEDGDITIGHVVVATGDNDVNEDDACGNCGEDCDDGYGGNCMTS